MGCAGVHAQLLPTSAGHRAIAAGGGPDTATRLAESNERLEFLGDSILGAIVSSYLFDRYSQFQEGSLTIRRSLLVNSRACQTMLTNLHVLNCLLIGPCMKYESPAQLPSSISEDLFEAIVGAIYEDGGFHKAQHFFLTRNAHFIQEALR